MFATLFTTVPKTVAWFAINTTINIAESCLRSYVAGHLATLDFSVAVGDDNFAQIKTPNVDDSATVHPATANRFASSTFTSSSPFMTKGFVGDELTGTTIISRPSSPTPSEDSGYFSSVDSPSCSDSSDDEDEPTTDTDEVEHVNAPVRAHAPTTVHIRSSSLSIHAPVFTPSYKASLNALAPPFTPSTAEETSDSDDYLPTFVDLPSLRRPLPARRFNVPISALEDKVRDSSLALRYSAMRNSAHYQGLPAFVTPKGQRIDLTTFSSVPSLETFQRFQIICIGGVIGTGRFLGTANALRNGGPLDLLMGYSFMGSITFAVMIILGEMIAHLPIPGGHISLAQRFVNPSFSFTMGWNYWYNWTIVLPAELNAAAVLIGYWNNEKNPATWITVYLVVAVAINLGGTRAYGKMEFWFAIIKVLTIVGLIISMQRQLIRTALRAPRYSVRTLATEATVVPPPTEQAAPHAGIPFAAKPKPVQGVDPSYVPILMPDLREKEVVVKLKIPSEPDNYTLASDPAKAIPDFEPPKLHTVTSPATHPGGGPQHAILSDDVQKGESGDSTSALPKEAVAPESKNESKKGSSSSSSSSSSKEDGEKNDSGRPLNGEERKGVLQLLAILVGGWFVAGLAAPKRPKAEEEDTKDEVKKAAK